MAAIKTNPKSFRFSDETIAQLRLLAEHTRKKEATIVEDAIADAFRGHFGQRAADLVPRRLRSPGDGRRVEIPRPLPDHHQDLE